MSDSVKYLLGEQDIPKSWYNINADLPVPLDPVSTRHETAHWPGRPGGDLPPRRHRTGDEHRPRDRDPRTGARRLPPVAPVAAVPAPAVWRRPSRRLPGSIQVRGRQSRGQPQAQHRHTPGLLQQGGRGQPNYHRDRRRAVGLLAGTRRGVLRIGNRRLHGQGELPAEALPPRLHGNLRGPVHRQPERHHRVRAGHPGRAPGQHREPGYRHQRGGGDGRTA